MPSTTSGMWQGGDDQIRTLEARHEPQYQPPEPFKLNRREDSPIQFRQPGHFFKLREANIARQAEWDPSDQITWEFRGNELGGEAGEVQNVIKKLARERMGIRGSRDTVEHLAEELADVMICVDLIAMMFGIDLEKAVAQKFNATSEANGLKTRLVV